MGEERLIEIASTIIKLDGTLGRMAYLSSLSESEIYLFLKYIGTYRYKGMNICDAVVAFSQDYLKSKNITLTDNFIAEEKGKPDSEARLISYLDKMVANDTQIQLARGVKRK